MSAQLWADERARRHWVAEGTNLPLFHLAEPSPIVAKLQHPRRSHLRGHVLPGQAQGGDFSCGERLGCTLAKLPDDDHRAELDEHVED